MATWTTKQYYIKKKISFRKSQYDVRPKAETENVGFFFLNFLSSFEGDFFFFEIYSVKLLKYLCGEVACNTLLNACWLSACCCFFFFDIFVVNLIYKRIYIHVLLPTISSNVECVSYCVIVYMYFLQIKKSQRNQCSKWPFHSCAKSYYAFCISFISCISHVNQVYLTCGCIHTCILC